jgi:hypothetical protein
VSDLQKAERALAAAKARILAGVKADYRRMGETREKFIASVRAAKDDGMSWREIGEALGRSHEWVRSVYNSKR